MTTYGYAFQVVVSFILQNTWNLAICTDYADFLEILIEVYSAFGHHEVVPMASNCQP